LTGQAWLLVCGRFFAGRSGPKVVQTAALGLLLLWREQNRSAHVAQLVEHVLGKDEVTGSIPVMGSSEPPSKKARDEVWFNTGEFENG
jgi:hypothetical protein